MIEIIFLAVLLSSIAAFWDLLTTEVPDDIPALMIAFGIFFWFIKALSGDWLPLMVSLATGTLILSIGLLLYKKGKWGGADAWILAAIFYMVPLTDRGVFAMDYLYNLLIVSSAYTILYALVLGLLHRHVFRYLLDDIKANVKKVLVISATILSFSALVYAYNLPASFLNIIIFTAFLLIFWRYAKIIEAKVFTRRIPTKELKTGDVLQNMIWRGLTYEEVRRIKRQKKYVVIKEGMRFVPVFPITLIVTLLYGNLMFLFLVI